MSCDRSEFVCRGVNNTGSYSIGDYQACLEGGAYRKGNGINVPACPAEPKDYPPPGGVERKCLDEKTIAVWNQRANKYDSAICSTGHCSNGYCDAPPKGDGGDGGKDGKCKAGDRYKAGGLEMIFGCKDGYGRPLGGDYCECQSVENKDEQLTDPLSMLMQNLPMLLTVAVLVAVLGIFKK